jgi:basic amino acid/polyamine antiporter, APA family
MMTHQPVSKKALGIWTLTALVSGNMMGSGVFLLPSSLAAYGSISLLAWIFTALGSLTLALVFAHLSMILPKTGGPYIYCRVSFGEFVGFQIAYNYWISVWVGNAAIAVALIGYLSFLWPQLGADPVLSCLLSLGFVWLITLIHLLGLRCVALIQLITTILKFFPLLLIAFVGLFFLHPHYFSVFNRTQDSNLFAFSSAASITLWSFIGLESASVPADSVENPQRTIPRATILGVLVVTVVYLLGYIAIAGVVSPEQLLHSTAPYADAAKVLFGPIGSKMIAWAAIISCLGALNGWTLLQAQIPMACARDGIFPKFFARESEKGAPIWGLICSSVLVSLLLLLTLHHSLIKQFTLIILLATLGALIAYFFTTMAGLILHDPTQSRKKRWGSTMIAVLAGLYSFWMIMGAGQEIVFYGTLLFLSSLPIYVLLKRKKSSIGQ